MYSLFISAFIIICLSFMLGCNSNIGIKSSNEASTGVNNSDNSKNQIDIKAESQIISKAFFSKSLDKKMSASIYLPPGYSTEEKYPVLYLLYGYGGEHGSWFSGLKLNVKVDQLIQSDQIHPLIIVSPDYGNSFGVNTIPGEGANPEGVDEGNYEDYIVQDLISYVDARYSTVSTKDGRYIGGASMGGYAALYLGFTYPELFSKVGGHSSAIWNYTNSDQFKNQRDWLYASDSLRERRDPFSLAKNPSISELQVYLDAGDRDKLTEKNKSLYDLLIAKNVSAQWHPSSGGHNYVYWMSQLDNYLLFYAGK